MVGNPEKQPGKILPGYSLAFPWLLLFLSEALGMETPHFFNIEIGVWHGLLVDSLSVSVLMACALLIWLHFQSGKARWGM